MRPTRRQSILGAAAALSGTWVTSRQALPDDPPRRCDWVPDAPTGEVHGSVDALSEPVPANPHAFDIRIFQSGTLTAAARRAGDETHPKSVVSNVLDRFPFFAPITGGQLPLQGGTLRLTWRRLRRRDVEGDVSVLLTTTLRGNHLGFGGHGAAVVDATALIDGRVGTRRFVNSAPTRVAAIVLHEVGHALGLHHGDATVRPVRPGVPPIVTVMATTYENMILEYSERSTGALRNQLDA